VKLLRVDGAELAVRIGAEPLDVLDSVQSPAPRLLHHLPRNALVGVVDRCRGTDHLRGKAATESLELELLFGQ
jgi:hypothetical protein